MMRRPATQAAALGGPDPLTGLQPPAHGPASGAEIRRVRP